MIPCLDLDRISYGLKGWQWLFLIEGVPTILFGFVFLAIMPNRPRNATWLSAEEREWL